MATWVPRSKQRRKVENKKVVGKKGHLFISGVCKHCGLELSVFVQERLRLRRDLPCKKYDTLPDRWPAGAFMTWQRFLRRKW